jgi:signal transduction histidine kinase
MSEVQNSDFDPMANELAVERAKRRLAERQLAEQRQFVACLIHDFRSPLNAIAGFAEIMQDERFGPLGNARYAQYARDIRSAALNLADFVADTLDRARFEAGQYRLEEDYVALAPVVERCRDALAGLAARKNIGLLFAPEDEVSLLADPRALRQIVINLLSNAIKFSNPAGRVSVEIQRDEDMRVVLAVSDQGCGIAPGDLDKLRIPYALSRPGGAGEAGTGLGLSIVHNLTALHGGSVEFENRPGGGTRVRVLLPAWRAQAQERSPSWSDWQ